jgi:uncharacterized membrane protein YkgB
VPQNAKKVWYSKSNIFGALQVTAGIAGVLVGSEFIQQWPGLVAGAITVSGGITIALRFLTTMPVEW